MRINITFNINDKLVRFGKKILTSKNTIFGIAIIFFICGLFIFSDELPKPHNFQTGDIIYANELNENFNKLYERKLGEHPDVNTTGVGNGKILKYQDGIWVISNDETIDGDGDDFGDHTATQNINLNGNWLSGDGENEGIYVATNGNVGIGTNSPDTALDVNGSLKVGEYTLPAADGSDGDVLTADGAGGVTWQSGGDGDSKWEGTTNIYYTDGNVGIGATNPANQLYVTDSSNAPAVPPLGATVYFRNAYAGSSYASRALYARSDGGHGQAVYAHAAASSGDSTALYSDCDSSTGYAGYFVGGRNYFQGNVGIGTSTPDEKLHVNGNIKANGSIFTKTGSGVATVLSSSEWAGGQIWKIYATADPPTDATVYGEFTLFIRPDGQTGSDWYHIETVAQNGVTFTFNGSGFRIGLNATAYDLTWSAMRLK